MNPLPSSTYAVLVGTEIGFWRLAAEMIAGFTKLEVADSEVDLPL